MYLVDPMAVERERKLINPWTEDEKQIFIKKFLHYGKFFSRISYYIENKSTAVSFQFVSRNLHDIGRGLVLLCK